MGDWDGLIWMGALTCVLLIGGLVCAWIWLAWWLALLLTILAAYPVLIGVACIATIVGIL